jgi:endonuclease YncB( thermonuclease family)
MTKLLFIIQVIFFFLLGPSLTGKVIGVSDGDTITILVDNQQIKIRLNGIDCPEKSQDFGQVAKQFTSDQCFGKTVTVITHGQDRYGRTLGEVILPDGKSLNQELVRAGLAWHYKKYSTDTTLADLEIAARNEKKGLWCQSDCVAPWEYRKHKN